MLLRELKKRAPTLLSILQAAAQPTRKCDPSITVICMAAAVLLKQRNQQMCLLQSIVAVVLYAGHAAKKVGNYVCASDSLHLIGLISGVYTACQTWTMC